MTLEYMGGWGDRPESARASAERVQCSWRTFPQVDSLYTQWSLQTYPEGALQLLPVPEGDLGSIVEAARIVTERINEGPRRSPGQYLEFVRRRLDSEEADPRLYSYKVRCGFAGPRAPRNHLFLQLDPAAGNPTDERQVVRDHLTALVRAWEPEHLSVCTYSFHKAQQHRTPQIRVGWLTYIRDDVPMDTRVLSRTVTVEFADGGRYLTLSGTALEPHLGDAMSVRRALGLPSHGQRFTVG